MVRIKTETFLKIMMDLVGEELCLEFDQVLYALEDSAADGNLPLEKPIYWIFRLPGDEKYSREFVTIRVREQVTEVYYQPEAPIFDLLRPDLYRIRLF